MELSTTQKQAGLPSLCHIIGLYHVITVFLIYIITPRSPQIETAVKRGLIAAFFLELSNLEHSGLLLLMHYRVWLWVT